MNRHSTILFTSIAMSALLVACSDNGTTGGTGGSGGTGSSSSQASSSTSTSASTSATSSATSSSSGGMPATLKVIAPFDPMKGELAEGLFVTPDNKTAFVGFAPTGNIVTVTLADGKVTPFGNVDTKFVPMMPPKGYLLGLLGDTGGDLYAGLASFDASVAPGVYHVSADGKTTTLFASDPGLTFPNGLVFDAAKNIFVSDSASGTIFKITPAKVISKWIADPLLQGDPTGPCKAGLGIPLGANGIAIVGTNMFVANTEKATLVKIPIDGTGKAGTPVVVTMSDATCMQLGGADGIAADTDGSIYVADNGLNSLVHIGTDGKAQTLISKDKFDSPASVSIATVAGVKQAIITNAAFASAQTPGGMPKPGLLSYGPLK